MYQVLFACLVNSSTTRYIITVSIIRPVLPECLMNVFNKGRLAALNRMTFRKCSGGGGLQILETLKRALWAWNWYKRVISGFRACFFNKCIETHQNGPYLWKSCARISYYLAIIPPRICATISVIKKLQHNFPKMRGGACLIFVIFFTLAKFLENKIYTEKRQFFALNL